MKLTFSVYIGIYKIVRKTFAVYRKSTKTIKLFSSITHVDYDTYIANIATCLAIRIYLAEIQLSTKLSFYFQ